MQWNVYTQANIRPFQNLLNSIKNILEQGGLILEFTTSLHRVEQFSIVLTRRPELGILEESVSSLLEPDSEPRTQEKPRQKTAKPGKIITDLRPFGVELELALRSRDEVEAVESLSLETGWHISGDGSIKARYGRELKSPAIAGADGEKQVNEISDKLKAIKATVNSSCGLHIHLDAHDLLDKPVELAKIMLAYIAYDDVFQAMLPAYRRFNHYAKKMSGYNLAKLREIANHEYSPTKGMEALQQVFYQTNLQDEINSHRDSKYDRSRYYGLNYHQLFRDHGLQTIEIRYHSPTIMAEKILPWIALHQQIIAKASQMPIKKLDGLQKLLFFEDKLVAFKSELKLNKKLADYVQKRVIIFNPKSKSCVV